MGGVFCVGFWLCFFTQRIPYCGSGIVSAVVETGSVSLSLYFL